MSESLSDALSREPETLWKSLDEKGVLKILTERDPFGLLLRDGRVIDVTGRDLEHLLVKQRAHIRSEIKKARGHRAYIGHRTRFNNYGGGSIFHISDAEPVYGIVGRDKNRLEELNKEWNDLNMWKSEIIGLFNFVQGGIIQIPARFLPKLDTKKSRGESSDLGKIAKAFVELCETHRITHPSLQQLNEVSGVSLQTVDRRLKTPEVLSLILKKVHSKINYAKLQARKDFWYGVESEVTVMIERLGKKKRTQREQPDGDMDRFPGSEEELE